MEINWKTFGHNTAKKILSLQVNSGRFAHTYLFLGPEGVGKKMLALEMAEKILATNNLKTHPDFLYFDVTSDTGIEQVRNFTEQLSFKPFLGEKKVAVINNAQNLNTQSQNALLKTLEEPPESSILILVTSKPLLGTISSRSLILHFNRFTLPQMQDFCQAASLKIPLAEISQCFGIPNKLFIENQNEVKEWSSVKILSKAEKLAVLPKWAEMEVLELSGLFEDSVLWEVENLHTDVSKFKTVNLLLEATENLKKNFNKKLVLQRLFMNI